MLLDGSPGSNATRTVQDILGHRSLRTTEVYVHVTVPGRERVQEVVDRLMLDL